MTIKEFTKKYKNVSGVYAIICGETGRSYVGSSISVGKRIRGHFSLLRKGKHQNSDLQKDFTLFGEPEFFFEILEETLIEEALERESYWMSFAENLYNKSGSFIRINLSMKHQKVFWSRVDIKTKDECWDWVGNSFNVQGYGRFSIGNKNGGGIRYISNRIAYFLTYPKDNQDFVVRHSCDNKKCCNPNHLSLGTYSDNSIDIREKNNQGHQKLNWEQVKSIRQKYLENVHINRDELFLWVQGNVISDISLMNILNICWNNTWYDKDYNPKPRRSSEIEQDVKDKFYDNPDIPCTKIRSYVLEKYGISVGESWTQRVFAGRTSNFGPIMNEVLKSRIIHLWNTGKSKYAIDKLLNKEGIRISYTTIQRTINNR